MYRQLFFEEDREEILRGYLCPSSVAAEQENVPPISCTLYSLDLMNFVQIVVESEREEK